MDDQTLAVTDPHPGAPGTLATGDVDAQDVRGPLRHAGRHAQ